MSMEDYNLDSSMENGKLRFVLSGRVDSTNARNFGEVVSAERKKHPNAGIVFECSGLEHITSARLRVLLALNGQGEKKIRFINVPQNIYDIFDMTGFFNIFEVSKALRDVSNETVRKMGYSNGITVYYICGETLM